MGVEGDFPLVSVLVHNFNYGRYLHECLNSVLSQTYNNIELIFSDNCSNDDSWAVALEIDKKYPGKMVLIRNRNNLGAEDNFKNCYNAAGGEYFISMCSDDVMSEQYVEKCMKIFQMDNKVGFVMVHRDIIDDAGALRHEPSFYDRSCIIDGEEQAAVYMMAAVNPSISQVMYDRQKVLGKYPFGGLMSRWYSARILDFNLCMAYSMGYISEPLLKHRLHNSNHSSEVSENMIELLANYLLNQHFYEVALVSGKSKIADRLPMSTKKLSELSVRYAVRFISIDLNVAKKYYHLAYVFNDRITDDPNFKLLNSYWSANDNDKMRIVTKLYKKENLLTRSVSYNPPTGSIDVDLSM